mmetsp:Transcript_37193/g.73038  ORF Transcript_37193/g.73038 Transcript_37193/m.73038 type:complete len:377 (-) Transcript_37193:747-1877(-)
MGKKAPEHFPHFRRPLEKQLHGRCEQSRLDNALSPHPSYRGISIDQLLQRVWSLDKNVSAFPEHPDHRRLPVWVGNVPQRFRQGRRDVTSQRGVSPQHVREATGPLRRHVRHERREFQKLNEAADDALRDGGTFRSRGAPWMEPARNSSHGAHRQTAETHVHVAHVLGQLAANILGRFGPREEREEVHLEVLNVGRLVVAHVHLPVLRVERPRAQTHQELHVRQERVGALGRGRRDVREEGSADALHHAHLHFRVAAREMQEDADRPEHRRGARRAQDRIQEVHNLEGLALVLRFVAGQQTEDRGHAELGELVQSVQEVQHDGTVEGHAPLRRHNLFQDYHTIGHHLGVRVAEHVVQHVDVVPLVESRAVQVVELQ